MPKINQAGPSYGGVSGNVTNATGQQFELTDPDQDGVVSLDGPEQLTPSTGTDADLAGPPPGQPVDEPVEQDDERSERVTPILQPKKTAGKTAPKK
jgi:hypothetical protein